jgi:hypothetical protein
MLNADMLKAKCGDQGGWIYFITWKLLGRKYVANDDGTYRSPCGQPIPNIGVAVLVWEAYQRLVIGHKLQI